MNKPWDYKERQKTKRGFGGERELKDRKKI